MIASAANKVVIAVSVTSGVNLDCTSLVAGVSTAVGWKTSTLELGVGNDNILANTSWASADAVP